ncbi:MAG: cryptochrome/photolyase family protein [Rickettsiales bacterium]
MTTLAWFRRDLRLHDHAVLHAALSRPGAVQPVFVFDSDILARFSNPADRRLGFIASALCHLDAQLRQRGGGLLVLHGRAVEVIPKLAQALSADAVVAAEDFEPATRARDAAVGQALGPNAAFIQPLDQLIHHPQALMKGDGTPYRVFTPFFKNWQALLSPTSAAAYEVSDAGRYADARANAKAAEHAGLNVVSLEHGPEAVLESIGYRYAPDALWDATAGPARLKEFIAHKLGGYARARDALDDVGTSRLSPYVRHGMVSIRECLHAAMASHLPPPSGGRSPEGRVGVSSSAAKEPPPDAHASTSPLKGEVSNHKAAEKWVSELAWREFYASVLFHFPEVVDQEFQEHYRGTIPWSADTTTRDAFLNAQTGFPVVDAALRELTQTGFMHNRARMIVASFASKDLLLDWRIGEEFFAQWLMDYDLASNNGGWQWAASTGTDAAPYFRIFNPVLQSKKFDPQGNYLRRYVPEIAHLPDAEIHAPWESPSPPAGYPAPIVDREMARKRALAAFKR